MKEDSSYDCKIGKCYHVEQTILETTECCCCLVAYLSMSALQIVLKERAPPDESVLESTVFCPTRDLFPNLNCRGSVAISSTWPVDDCYHGCCGEVGYSLVCSILCSPVAKRWLCFLPEFLLHWPPETTEQNIYEVFLTTICCSGLMLLKCEKRKWE